MRSEKYVYCKMQDVDENEVYKIQNNPPFCSHSAHYNIIVI